VVLRVAGRRGEQRILIEEYESGRTSSLSAIETLSEIWLPRTKTAVLGFSITFASRSSRARFTRADLGLLRSNDKSEGQRLRTSREV
jgi:hypothetical protein